MGCCDDDKKSLPDPSAQEEVLLVGQELDEHAHTVNVQADDVWATAEGYTPLADLHGSDPYGQTMMVAFGPDDDSENDEHDAPSSYSGAFFVNPSAFAAQANDHDDEEEEEQEETTAATSNVGQQEYQTIADTALLALDEEYQRTLLQGQRPTPRGEENGKVAPASTTNTTIPPTPTLQPVCLDDDDLKAIAAAFDSYSTHVKKDDDGKFEVSWDNVVPTATTQNTAVNKPSPVEVKVNKVDTAVSTLTMAVQALNNSTKSPFQQKFATWQLQQHQSHPIIPETPLKAFRRTTEKAKKATANLTRSATLAQALTRLESMNLLASASTLHNNHDDNNNNNNTLCIHIVGVDHVECESPARLQTLFRPLIRWLSNWKKFPLTHVELVLIGRDLNPQACANPVDLLFPTSPNMSTSTIQTAFAVCHTGVYHEWLASASCNNGTSTSHQPHLVIAFNAGIWGYQEWKPTLEYLNGRENIATPMVITAYTLPESEEDHAVLLDELFLPPSKCLWEPEPNPFGSKVKAPHSSNHEYRENAAWQAWNLGGS
jgi:hypothetical protein